MTTHKPSTNNAPAEGRDNNTDAKQTSLTVGARIKHIQTMLKLIEDLLEGKLTQDVQAYSIEARRMERMPLADLLACRRVYWQELTMLQRQQASHSNATVITRF